MFMFKLKVEQKSVFILFMFYISLISSIKLQTWTLTCGANKWEETRASNMLKRNQSNCIKHAYNI